MVLNGQITDVSLFLTPPDYLMFRITVQSDKYEAVIGEYILGGKIRAPHPEAIRCICSILDVVGVMRWEDLQGQYVRFTSDGENSVIEKIGNIVDDKWFDIWDVMGQECFMANDDCYLHLRKDKI